MIDNIENKVLGILEYIRRHTTEITYHGDITALENDNLKKLLFFNGYLKKTLRLNKTGNTILSQIMESWTIKMPDKFIVTGKHLLALDYNLKGLWYLDKKTITSFDTDDAVLLRMIDADFELFDGLR